MCVYLCTGVPMAKRSLGWCTFAVPLMYDCTTADLPMHVLMNVPADACACAVVCLVA